MTEFVLSAMRPRDRKDLDVMVEVAADAAQCWVGEGVTAAADRYNGFAELERD